MAQETAGTIGIPVLKNELLPYLTDYAKRSERAELYKQKAEQRAAELAAKKAAEDAKFVPEFEAGLGSDMWEHVDKAKNEADIQRGLALAKDPSVPRQQVALASKEINRGVSQRSNISKQLKESTLKTAEDLKKKGWNVGPEYAYQWAKQQQDYKSPQEFAAAVRSNPDLIDFDTIGKKGKEYRKSIYSIETPDGRSTKQVEMSPLFEYKWEKDPFTGGEVPVVTGVNGVEAQKLIEGDQDIKDAFQVFVKNNAEKYKAQTFTDPQTGSPIMLRPEVAEQKAAEDFMERAFGSYGKVKYGQSFQMPTRKGGAGGGGKPPVNIETKGVGPRSVDVSTYTQIGKPVGGKVNLGLSRQQVTIGDPNTDVETTYSRPYDVSANVPVYLLQRPEDISSDKEVINRYLTQKNDGTYTLKTGFEYQNNVHSTLYFADKDFWVYGPTGKKDNAYLIKKGTVLDNETALNYIRQGQSDKVRKVNGREVTANMAIPYETRRGDVVERVRPSIKMFIPESNAASIRKHSEMERRKMESANAPQAASEEKVIRF